MMRISRIGLPLVLVCAAGGLSGCARVNPKPDYQEVRLRTAHATGVPLAYDPDDDAVVAARVEALLKAGLTIDGAIEVCLLNNRDFQSAWMNVGMARADLVQSGLLSNPTLDLSLRFPAAGGLPDLDATLAQNIADLWKIPARKREARHALQAAILDLAGKAAGLAADTKGAYFHAVAAQQAVEIAQENLATAQKSLDLALVRQRAGAGAEVDVNLSRGPVLEAELGLRAARLEAGGARRALARLLGVVDDAQELVLMEGLPVPPAGTLDDEALDELAHAERLDLQSARQAAEVAGARVTEQWRAVFPNLALGIHTERAQRTKLPKRRILADTARATVANGQLTAPDIQPRSERRAAKRAARNDIITGPSFSLDIPVFDQNQVQIAKAVYDYRQAVKAYESVDRALTQDVRSAAAEATDAWAVVRFYRERSIPLAERSLELSRESYRAGKASLLEVLELQRFLLDTRSRYVQAAQNAATKIAELERAVGRPLRDIQACAASAPAASEPASQPSTRPVE
jgi:cobalt-zinc-cadmium efflux system outer membrane protein